MADDKSRKDKRDRNWVAGDEDYEIDYLTQKTGLGRGEALRPIQKHGNDRATLER